MGFKAFNQRADQTDLALNSTEIKAAITEKKKDSIPPKVEKKPYSPSEKKITSNPSEKK